MGAQIIDGKNFARKIRTNLTAKTTEFINRYKIKPTLAVILVGNDPASEVYVRNKGIQALEVGFNSLEFKMPNEITQSELINKINELNNDADVHGILVQLPLPKHINTEIILNAISPEKDVDGFHPINIGRLWAGNPISIPCTPLGCSLILEEYLGDLSGKKALVIGRSNIVGKPMAALLLAANATVTIAHSKSSFLPDLVSEADILVAAVGSPEMIKGAWIKKGATVLDVGINRIMDGEKNRLIGDVEFSEAVKHAAFITPVPGGIGPMTIACLLKNTLACAESLTFKQE